MNAALQAVAILGMAGWASAQELMYYAWDLNDSGSDTITIGPGETVTLKMYATWEPYEYIFAGSIYEVLGVESWETGEVTSYKNKIDDLGTGPGELQPNNDILGIESFVLPPFFGGYGYYPPAHLYEIEWVPSDYTPRTVRVTDTNHIINWLYIDDFGTTVEYDAAPSEGATIHIIPAPGGILALGLGGLMLAPRRYRAMP